MVALGTSEARPQQLIEEFGKLIPDSTVEKYRSDALKLIHLAKCEDDKPCAPASQKDIDHPPISLQDGRAALAFGIAAAWAELCGLNSQRAFLPMIAYGKYKLKMRDRPLQIMSLMYGSMKTRQLIIYKKNAGCPANVKEQIDAQLPKSGFE